MMTDEAKPPSSSSSDATIPPPEPDPPPNMASSTNPAQPKPVRSRAHSSGTSEDNQSSSPNSSSTPPWMKWSRGLASLLDDQNGRDLFERYLDEEGCSAQLNFLWACEGLKCTAIEDPPKIPQLVRSIHRHFFQTTTLLGISDGTRSDLAHAIIKEGRVNEVGLFDKAEAEVQTHMQNNLYPNFLKSEIYLRAVNGEEETSNLQEQLELPLTEASSVRKVPVGDSSSIGGVEESKSLTSALEVDVDQKSYNNSGGQSPKIPSPPLSTAPSVLLANQLQTVHEDKELSVNAQHSRSSKLKLGLTKEALQMTQMARATVLAAPASGASKIRREGFTSHYHQKPGNTSGTTPLHPYHASYSSYNPVSRVDSEIQSMSSDAMTDDGAHSGHGHSSARKHGAHSHRSKGQMCSSSSSQIQSHHHSHSSDSSRRQLGHSNVSLNNRDNLPFDVSFRPGLLGGPRDPLAAQKKPQSVTEFANILIEKLEEVKRKRDIEEKLSQKLYECDDHAVPNPVGACGGVEQITPNVLAAAINRLKDQDDGMPDDILDQHMSRVFSDITPDKRSPMLRSPTSSRRRGGPALPTARPRRERDLLSTFSGDSGNVHDMYPSDTLPSTISKSRSIPSELRLHDHGDFSSVSSAPQRPRFSRGMALGYGESRNVPMPLISRKTSTEFIDSGISVVSGATPTIHPTNQPTPSLPCDRIDLRTAHWVASDGRGDDRLRTRSTTSPPSSRRAKKPPVPPGLSQPILMEEVRKQLIVRKVGMPSSVLASQSVQVPMGPMSVSSVQPVRHRSPPSSDESSTVQRDYFISSFIYYDDIEVPYCVKVPCKKLPSPPAFTGGITLAVFKEHLPKRGNYRFFFKTECAEVHTKCVQEEITDDMQELPLYDGKIIAHLQTAVGASSTGGASLPEKI